MDERLRRPRLVGRTSQLALLGELFRTASSGVPSAGMIGGDAGCGRTRLLHEFLGTVPEGTLVLLGTCYGADRPVPFAPLLEALRSLPDDRCGPLAPAAALGQEPAAVFEQVLTRLEQVGRSRPVVLALDDIHLADPGTLDLLAFLVPNLRRSRTLLLLTWCSERLPRGADLGPYVASLTGDTGVIRVDLPPLARAELADLLADARGAPLHPAVEVACWERAEGNPFYALELLAAAGREGRPEPRGPLPETLAGLMLARLDALGHRAQRVVRVAAAAGRRVDHRLLAAATGLPTEELFEALREAVDRQVLLPTEDGRDYRFRHAVLHEAARARLLPGERRYILDRAAEPADRAPGRTAPGRIPVPRAPRLTPRELQVLSLVADGNSNRAIASELFISEKTASVHVSNILAKLGARSRTAAAAAAHRLGVLS